MAVLYDSSIGGAPITASGQVWNGGAETPLYLSVASNLISGQATGPSVQFKLYSRKLGLQLLQVDYGTTNTNYAVPRSGYLLEVVVPTGSGSVSCRVVVSTEPFPLTVQTVAATVTGTVSSNIAQVAGIPAQSQDGAIGAAGVIPGTDDAVETQPSQYDANGVRLQTQANILANGGDVVPPTASANIVPPAGTTQQNVSASPPVGQKWIIYALFGVIQGASDAVSIGLNSLDLIVKKTFAVNSGNAIVGTDFSSGSISETIAAAEQYAIVAGPGGTNISGFAPEAEAVYSCELGIVPIVVTSADQIELIASLTANGSEGVWMYIGFIGYQEPL